MPAHGAVLANRVGPHRVAFAPRAALEFQPADDGGIGREPALHTTERIAPHAERIEHAAIVERLDQRAAHASFDRHPRGRPAILLELRRCELPVHAQVEHRGATPTARGATPQLFAQCGAFREHRLSARAATEISQRHAVGAQAHLEPARARPWQGTPQRDGLAQQRFRRAPVGRLRVDERQRGERRGDRVRFGRHEPAPEFECFEQRGLRGVGPVHRAVHVAEPHQALADFTRAKRQQLTAQQQRLAAQGQRFRQRPARVLHVARELQQALRHQRVPLAEDAAAHGKCCLIEP